jgi:perosamine synthetase
VEPGDEVLTVSFSWYCTATSILQVGAVPVFVDIEPDTFSMDPKLIEEKITSRTKAILGVSLYGHPASYDLIMKIAHKFGLPVIDDACQSVGAKLNGKYLGNVADMTAFSFSGKPIVSTGGGIITTNSEEYFERSMLGGEHPSFISTHAKNPSVWKLASTGGYGNHYRIDGKCAERAYEQLEKLDAINEHRRKNVFRLNENLSRFSGITKPVEKSGAYHVYHMYSCLFDSVHYGITRDEFVDALNAEGVPTLTYISSVNFLKYPDGEAFSAGPLHQRHLFQELARTGRCGPFRFPDSSKVDYSTGSLPVTERIVNQEFNIHQRYLGAPFSEKTMDEYALAVEKVLENREEIMAHRSISRKREANFLVAYQSDA